MCGVIVLKDTSTKKGYFAPILALILSSLAFLLLSYLSYQQIGQMASALAAAEATPKIVLDPGHGGEDGGAQGTSGTLEKELNLAISLELQKLFEQSGFPTVMIRTEDVSIGNSSLQTVRERKVSDIHNRLKIVEEQGDCILLSIHQNHFTSARYSGTQVFYSKNDPKSEILAESIQKNVVSLLQPENNRLCKPATSSIYLLWNTKVPAVLVECGFLSNESESKKLNEPLYQKQMAFSIYTGFLDYLQELRQGTAHS